MDGDETIFHDSMVYDIVHDIWMNAYQKSEMSETSRFGHAATVIDHSKFVVCGGVNAKDDIISLLEVSLVELN